MFCVKGFLCRGVDIKVNYVMRRIHMTHSSCWDVGAAAQQQSNNSELFWSVSVDVRRLQLWPTETKSWGRVVYQQVRAGGKRFFCSWRGRAVVLIVCMCVCCIREWPAGGSRAQWGQQSSWGDELIQHTLTVLKGLILNCLINLHIWSLLVFLNPPCVSVCVR